MSATLNGVSVDTSAGTHPDLPLGSFVSDFSTPGPSLSPVPPMSQRHPSCAPDGPAKAYQQGKQQPCPSATTRKQFRPAIFAATTFYITARRLPQKRKTSISNSVYTSSRRYRECSRRICKLVSTSSKSSELSCAKNNERSRTKTRHFAAPSMTSPVHNPRFPSA